MTTAREDEEKEASAIAKFKPKFVLDGGIVHTYAPVKGRRTKDGDADDSMVGITIRVPVGEMTRYMGLITRLWNKETPVTLGLMYVEPAEQMKTGITEAARQNGSGHPPATGLEPIPIDRKGGKKRETAKA